MINALLIDDEPLACAVVSEYLQHHPDIHVVGMCHNGFEGVKLIQELKPDVVFLDVQMPKISGLEMLELLDEIPPIIFTTAFDEYAVSAFEANAIDYLLKPFSKERFNQSIEKLKSRSESLIPDISQLQQQATTRIVLKDAGEIQIIPLEEVLLIEADDDYVKIITQKKSFLKKATLTHYETSLPETQFVRVHRSFLLNVSQVTKIEPYEKTSHLAILRNGQKVPVSRSGYQRLKEALGL